MRLPTPIPRRAWLLLLLAGSASGQNHAVPKVTPGGTSAAELSRRLQQLQSPDTREFRAAAFELCPFGEAGSAGLPHLVSALNNADQEVRRVAVYALGCLGPAGLPAVDFVAARLRDRNEDPEVRKSAADALRKMRSLPDGALRALSEALNDKDSNIQRSAAFSLAAVGYFAHAAVPALIRMLGDPDWEVRRVAGWALARIGPGASAATDGLIHLLQNDNKPEVREVAAYALRQIGHTAQQAIPALEEALADSSYDVQRNAAEALQRIAGQSSVGLFVRALSNADPNVARAAADALAHTGLAGRTAIPHLIPLLRHSDAQVQSAAAESISNIAASLQDSTEWNSITVLREALNALAAARHAAPEHISARALAQVRSAIRTLEAARRNQPLYRVGAWLSRPWTATAAALAAAWVLGFLYLRLWVLRRCPRRLLAWNDALETYEFKLPGWLGETRVPVRHILLVGFYRYHDRVLDDWVATYAGAAREHLRHNRVFEAHSVYVPLPVMIDGSPRSHVAVEDLRHVCSRNRWYVLIEGAGGTGKTTLACQMALWCLEPERSKRLISDRQAIPIVIDPGLGVSAGSNVNVLQETVRGQLRVAIDAADPVREGLMVHLLRTRRVVVLLDGVTEMNPEPGVAAEARLRFDAPELPINAVIVTAREAEASLGTPEATIIPIGIGSNHLLPFMNTYLSSAGVSVPDSQLYEACRRLAELVGENRPINPLLARLCAEEIIASSGEGGSALDVPANIPDLMLQYLNNLNRYRGTADPDNPTVHRVLQLVAWASLRQTFRPVPASKAEVMALLAADRLNPDVLTYAERRLRVIRTAGHDELSVQFVLDPLAEYLAALHFVCTAGQAWEAWQDLLVHMGEAANPPSLIRGFIGALVDCCHARPAQAPPGDVIAELQRRMARPATVAYRAVPNGSEPAPSIESGAPIGLI